MFYLRQDSKYFEYAESSMVCQSGKSVFLTINKSNSLSGIAKKSSSELTLEI